MATKFYTWTGTINWPKLTEEFKDTKYDDNGIYSVNFYPTNFEAVKESGIQVEPKMDKETGDLYFKLSRKHMQVFKNEIKTLGPPEVRYNREPYTGAIGNGSKVTVNVGIFDTKKGKGHRLERVTVNELVEYVSTPKDEDDVIPF
jgi:hypothetical protein